MDAIHILRKKKYIADFESFVMVLSALEWRKHNGNIKLVTDQLGLDFVQKHGIANVWNRIDVSLDELNELPIRENVFWAGAKIVALQQQKAPCVMMDLDFIVWKTLDFSKYENELAVIHREDIDMSIYPPKDFFHVKDYYTFDTRWNWSVLPCNTAFSFFGNELLRRMYCDEAIRFMCHADVKDDYLCYMVFAEQRLLAMCADMLQCRIHSFCQLRDLFDGRQNVFTHIWGEKEALRKNKIYNDMFCHRCMRRIKRDFPQWAEWLKYYEWFRTYMKV